MKRIFHMLSVIMLATMALSSCLSTDDDSTTVTLYGDAAITDFALGTFNRYLYVTSSSGQKDSLVKSVFTGSVYKMNIDQLNNVIFNKDSLPYGSDVRHILCTVTTKNGGGVAIFNPDSTLKWHSSTDSVDLSTTRIFRIFATDGSYQRDYSVSLNVARLTGNMEWKQVADTTLLSGYSAMRAVTLGQQLLLFAQKDGSTEILSSTDGRQWQTVTPQTNTPITADAWKNVAVKDSFVYLLNNTSLLRISQTGQWKQVSNAPDVAQLIGAGTRELFALGTDGELKSSTDDGISWVTEQRDDSLDYLPTEGIATVTTAYAPADSVDYVLLVGNNGSQTRVWRKLSQYGGTKRGGQWIYMTATDTNRNQLPLHQQLSMVSYDGNILAAGSGMTIYQTRDQGITWNSAYTLPTTLAGSTAALAVSPEGALLLLTNGGQVWQWSNE